MRCNFCKKIDESTLNLDGDPLPFHSTFPEFERSAISGCEICSVLWWQLEPCRGIGGVSKSKYDILRTSNGSLQLSLESDMEWIGWEHGALTLRVCDSTIGEVTFEEELDYEGWYPLARAEVLSGRDGASPDDLQPETTESAASFAERAMQECVGHHTECQTLMKQINTHSSGPTRVLDLGAEDIFPNVRLVSWKRDLAYATLSYRWGATAHAATTTKLNFDQRCELIHLDELPRTFRDVVKLCRRCNIRHLWVDALCIIQPTSDDQSDWIAEGGRMGSIYANGLLNVSATSAETAYEGLFAQFAPDLPVPRRRARLFSPADPKKLYISPRPTEKSEQYLYWEHVNRSALNTRAWVLQEQLLSVRRLQCSKSILRWRCHRSLMISRSGERAEIVDDAKLGLAKMAYIGPNDKAETSVMAAERSTYWLNDVWSQIVRDYSRRDLSTSTDRMPALSGIASGIASKTLAPYLGGVWHPFFVRQLHWHLDRYAGHALPLPEQNIAPSWSWASLGRTSLVETDRWESAHVLSEMCRMLKVEIRPSSLDNRFGHVKPDGWAELEGPLLGPVRASVEEMRYEESNTTHSYANNRCFRLTETPFLCESLYDRNAGRCGSGLCHGRCTFDFVEARSLRFSLLLLSYEEQFKTFHAMLVTDQLGSGRWRRIGFADLRDPGMAARARSTRMKLF